MRTVAQERVARKLILPLILPLIFRLTGISVGAILPPTFQKGTLNQMLIRIPLEIEQRNPKRRRVWVTNLAGLLVVVLTIALTYVVLAAVTE